MAIICTEDDKEFKQYEDEIKNRKVRFHLKYIFKDHWNNFLSEYTNLNIRQSVFDNVKRILKCKTIDLGFDVFTCPNCGHEHISMHTCKSKFCPSCGNKYNNERAISIMSKLFNRMHRHVVWTIPEELRKYFREDRTRLNLLFKAAQLTVETYFSDKFSKQNIIPAFISILHTYGRDIKWNPHIHMILLEGGVGKNGFKVVDYFSYASFRKRFMKILLDLLDTEINTKEFKTLKKELYRKYKDGFYVFAPKSKFKNLDGLITYVTRYVAKPVMAESRIIDYDGTYVTFWYQRHEDDKVVIERLHVYEFISRLIIHIPEKNAKYIRYYGCYNESTKSITEQMKRVYRKFNKKVIESKRKLNKWRLNITTSFNIDPLKCPICNTLMRFSESVSGGG